MMYFIGGVLFLILMTMLLGRERVLAFILLAVLLAIAGTVIFFAIVFLSAVPKNVWDDLNRVVIGLVVIFILSVPVIETHRRLKKWLPKWSDFKRNALLVCIMIVLSLPIIVVSVMSGVR